MPRGARILDLGHGCGDSLLLLAELAPRCLHGVTSLPAHAERAQARLGDGARVWCDDAVAWLARVADGALPAYDVIFVLDCAYHFSDRAAFFQHASQRLAPNGVLVLVDLVSAWPYPAASPTMHTSTLPAPTRAPSWWATCRHALVCWLSGANARWFVSFEAYEAELRAVGFKDVHLADLSHDVFPGFAAFLQGLGRGEERAWRGGHASWRALHAFGAQVHTWAQGGDDGLVRCALVVAR